MEEDSNVLMSMSRRIPTFLEEEATFLLLVSTTGLGSCLLRESETE